MVPSFPLECALLATHATHTLAHVGMLEEPFGDALRRLREAAGLTQEQLAERAGLSFNAISSLERGERQRPYPNTLQALAAALDLIPSSTPISKS